MGLTETGRILAVMKPLLDMLNHNRASQNEMCFQHGAFQLVHRGPGICPGEEVRLVHNNRCHWMCLKGLDTCLKYTLCMSMELGAAYSYVYWTTNISRVSNSGFPSAHWISPLHENQAMPEASYGDQGSVFMRP